MATRSQGLVLLLLLMTSATSSAHELVIQPRVPSADQSFVALLHADFPVTTPFLEYGLPDLELYAHPIEPAYGNASRYHVADVDTIPAGVHVLRWLRVEGNDGTTTLAEVSFQVAPPLTIEAAGGPPEEGESFAIRVAGIGDCATLHGPPTRVGEAFELSFSRVCPEAVYFNPEGAAFDLQTAPVGPLPAGRYPVVVREHGTTGVVGRGVVEVLPTAPRLAGQFAVEVGWATAEATGEGRLVSTPGPESALYYFFDPGNTELLVKVLPGCAINGHYWVFAAASTTVGFTIDVQGPAGVAPRSYVHPGGTPAEAIVDVQAFPCSAL